MFLEGGWKPSREPHRRYPRMTDRDERTLLWLVVVVALLLLVAPIGGATIIEALAR